MVEYAAIFAGAVIALALGAALGASLPRYACDPGFILTTDYNGAPVCVSGHRSPEVR